MSTPSRTSCCRSGRRAPRPPPPRPPRWASPTHVRRHRGGRRGAHTLRAVLGCLGSRQNEPPPPSSPGRFQPPPRASHAFQAPSPSPSNWQSAPWRAARASWRSCWPPRTTSCWRPRSWRPRSLQRRRASWRCSRWVLGGAAVRSFWRYGKCQGVELRGASRQSRTWLHSWPHHPAPAYPAPRPAGAVRRPGASGGGGPGRCCGARGTGG